MISVLSMVVVAIAGSELTVAREPAVELEGGMLVSGDSLGGFLDLHLFDGWGIGGGVFQHLFDRHNRSYFVSLQRGSISLSVGKAIFRIRSLRPWRENLGYRCYPKGMPRWTPPGWRGGIGAGLEDTDTICGQSERQYRIYLTPSERWFIALGYRHISRSISGLSLLLGLQVKPPIAYVASIEPITCVIPQNSLGGYCFINPQTDTPFSIAGTLDPEITVIVGLSMEFSI